jgi:hypothetical protein
VTATVLPAHFPEGSRPVCDWRDRVVFVVEGGGQVRVRWHLGRRRRWSCDACGLMDSAACVHTFAAALLLAEDVLGLRRVPELEATTNRIPAGQEGG